MSSTRLLTSLLIVAAMLFVVDEAIAANGVFADGVFRNCPDPYQAPKPCFVGSSGEPTGCPGNCVCLTNLEAGYVRGPGECKSIA
uniref:Putative secreted protein n=1 Tax=Amblyomma americanum TaxID=6943 RepID=A0A0C9RVN3_AMBAM